METSVHFGGKYSLWRFFTVFFVRENPEQTFYWFFEATCPVARERGEWTEHANWIKTNREVY